MRRIRFDSPGSVQVVLGQVDYSIEGVSLVMQCAVLASVSRIVQVGRAHTAWERADLCRRMALNICAFVGAPAAVKAVGGLARMALCQKTGTGSFLGLEQADRTSNAQSGFRIDYGSEPAGISLCLLASIC